MKKLLLLLLTTTIYADDLDLGDDFSTGETVTAEKFNSKFNKLETVSRLVKDSDLIGTWKCRSILNYESSPFKQFDGGFLWYLDGVITFSKSNQKINDCLFHCHHRYHQCLHLNPVLVFYLDVCSLDYKNYFFWFVY